MRTQKNDNLNQGAARRVATILTLTMAIGWVCCPHAAQAQAWNLIDDFQSYDIGLVRDGVTGGAWVAHGSPPGTANAAIAEDDGVKFLEVGFDHTSNYRQASHELHSDYRLDAGDGIATYFFRTRYTANHHRVDFGLAGPDLDTTNHNPDFGNIVTQVLINQAGEVWYRDGSGFVENVATVSQGEWVNFWMVVDRTTGVDTWDLYMTTGQNDATASDRIGQGASFRNVHELRHFFFAARSTENELTAHLNDVYYCSGANRFIPRVISTTDGTGGVSGTVEYDDGGDFPSGEFGGEVLSPYSRFSEENRARKAYVRFDTSAIEFDVAEASLTFTVTHNELGGHSGYLRLYAFTDQNVDTQTLNNDLTWDDAPGNNPNHGSEPDLNQAIYLGEKRVTVSSLTGSKQVDAGDTITWDASALVEFLNDNTNNIVTFMVTRFERSGSRDDLIVGLAGDSHPMYAAPFLTVTPAPEIPDYSLVVEHHFGGSAGTGLNGVVFDFVSPFLESAGGTPNWVAASEFRADGSVNSTTRRNAHVRLGDMINDAKGTPYGRFAATVTLAQPPENWLSVMFHESPEPEGTWHHTGGNESVGALLYDSDGNLDTKVRGNEFQLNSVATGLSGERTLTVTLDFTPASGYDGETNHGVITWSDSELGVLRKHILPEDAPVGSILLSCSADGVTSEDGYSYFRFERILPPVWFPDPVTPVTVMLDLVEGDPAYNHLDITATPSLALPPNTQTTEVTGTLEAYFTVDPRTNTSEVFLMTGAGLISNTDVHFQGSGLFGTVQYCYRSDYSLKQGL